MMYQTRNCTMGQLARGAALSLLAGLLFAGCSDSHLYGIGMEDPTADRLGLTGRVCTDDPREAGFPVKVIFLVDTAMGPMFGEFDPELIRLQALRMGQPLSSS